MPIPPNLLFTHDDVEATAGVAPWDRQAEFHSEINPDDIAATATAYAKAAAEARSAQDLAVRATELSQRPGGWEGAPLVDGEGRVLETSEGLRQGGDDIDRVTEQIGRAMAAAQDTDEQVTDLIHGPEGLNVRFDEHIQQLIADWEAVEGARDAAIQQWVTDHQDHFGEPAYWPSVTYASTTTELDRVSQGGNNYLFSLPESMVGAVRQVHLDNAVASATQVNGDMDAAVERYRQGLTEQAGVLRGLGYEPSEGPFALFTNREMARFAADKLDLELAEPGLPPDPHLVDLYTEQLAEIRENAYEGPGAPHLTPGEREYLSSFYGALDADTLAKLGQLGYDADPHHMADAQRATVADGITMLMNQDDGFGGIAPEDAPESIRSFVYDYGESGLIPATNPFGGFDGSLTEAWQRHNGFGDLMAAATVASGGTFSQDLAHAALDIEERSQMPLGEGHVPPVNTGSSGMLHATSLNTLASAQLLNQEDFRQGLLNQAWDRGAGAGELIHSGTTPTSTDPGQVPRDYVEAAYNVLTDAPEYQGSLLTPGADNAAVQEAIGTTALNYMDLISRPGADGGDTGFTGWLFGNGDESTAGMWATPQELRFNGHDQPFREGFDLSREQRQGLFGLMHQAEGDIGQRFFDGVTRWESATAYNDFVREGGPQADTFRNIGTIAGTVEHVRGPGDVWSPGNARISGLGSVSALAGFAAGLADASGPVAGTVALGAFGIGEGLRPLTDTAPVVEEAHWDALESGDIAVRTAVADAAVAAGYGGAAEDTELQRPDGTSVSHHPTNYNAYADRATEHYNTYADTLREGYNDALG